jgi:transcriptional regulator with XRE-family HTH domain
METGGGRTTEVNKGAIVKVNVDALKALRERSELSQRELADLAGVSNKLISRLERKERRGARVGTIRAIADTLRVPMVALLAGPVEDETASP